MIRAKAAQQRDKGQREIAGSVERPGNELFVPRPNPVVKMVALALLALAFAAALGLFLSALR